MPSEPQSQPDEVILTGTRGEYSWLTSSHDHYSGTLVKLCPEIFIGHYLAVTEIDSGTPWLTEQQKAGGWTQRREIVYSTRLNSVDDVFYQRDGHDVPGFDEWYFFQNPRDLGELQQGNPFEEATAPRPGRTMTFVGWPSATLHDLDKQVGEMFWEQMSWIRPESYIADSWNCLTFVTRNRDLFRLVLDRLSKSQPSDPVKV